MDSPATCAGVREGDCVGRFGGDEFVLVVAGLSCVAEALVLLRRLQASLRMPYVLPGGHRVQVGLSMGLSVFPDDDSDAQDLLRHADAALYRAKSDKSPQAPRCVTWTQGFGAGVQSAEPDSGQGRGCVSTSPGTESGSA